MVAVVDKVKKQKKGDETEGRLKKWTGKIMRGQFVRKAKKMRWNKSWMWLTRGFSGRVTESMLAAAQDRHLSALSCPKCVKWKW